MTAGFSLRGAITFLVAIFLFFTACSRKKSDAPADHPRLTPDVTMRDVIFHSAALDRDMPYRVIFPSNMPSQQKLPVVYLLHGGGGGYRDWSNYSDVAHFAEQGLILVMPEGYDSYYTNAADRPHDRYEDYIVNDLIADVEHRFPVVAGRASRAIMGVSMGGFGAVKIALKYPDLFSYAAGISPAVDVPTRRFSVKRPLQWRHYRSIFGPWGGQVQRENDPFVLARTADPAKIPHMFLTCGNEEGLLASNRQFASLLAQRHLQHEFHVVPGRHDWTQWNHRLADCFEKLSSIHPTKTEHRRRE
jgi:putative tributyrin esterase